ncbi:MAG: hypothetical protein J5531_10180 [Lachnospiraceae bacterium]|nr:hypothetical protein [Lachnospiraceae bacterium]
MKDVNVNQSKIKKILAEGAMILMVGVTAAGCGKKTPKTPAEPVSVETVTPTDEVTPTNTVEPTNTVAPTEVPATPTPTPIESKITTKTEPSNVEGYTEITSLSARDIKEGSMIQEYDKIVEVKEYAKDMNLGSVTSNDLVSSLEENNVLDVETKTVVEDVVKAFDTNKIDVPKAALYTNLSNLKIEYGNYNTDRSVIFDPFTDTIYVNTNVAKTEEEKKAAIELGLGYASLETYIEVDGEKWLCSPSVYCYDANGNIVEQGGFAKNAVAQIIANKLDGKDSISPKDSNYYDVLKFTVALNYINPNDPYTYEKYVTDGYTPFAKLICTYADPTDLLSAENACADLTPIDGIDTEDKEFIAAYNLSKKLIKPDLDYLHDNKVAGNDYETEKIYMRITIDNFFNEIQGYKLEGEESFISALYLLTNNYKKE